VCSSDLKYDILFVADEVITGFGRTGKMWGSETFTIEPDLMSCAKALSSGALPISALMISDKVYQAMLSQSEQLGSFAHGHTYAGHPVGAAVALKTIEIYERENLIGHAKDLGSTFERRVKALEDHPLVGEGRGKGLLGAVELVADKATKKPFDPKMMVGAKCNGLIQDEGLILRNMGDTIGICPPLIITEDELNTLFDKLEAGLDKTELWVKQEGLR